MKTSFFQFRVGLLALFFLTSRLPGAAQAPAWQSARAVAVATGATNDASEVTATAVDAAGNVYLAGNFTNTVVLGGTTLTSLGSYDVFVAKFNPTSNQFVWAQRAGGTGTDAVSALAVSGTSVYVAGGFDSPTAGFGPTTLSNAGGADVFIARLLDAGTTGNFVWAQRAGGSGSDQPFALAVSGTSVYVTGFYSGSTAGFGATILTSVGAFDIFVAKLTDAGNTSSFVWAQRAGGTGNEAALALAVSGTSVYVAGGFDSSTAGFGPTTLTNTRAGTADVFVAKLTDAGNFVWAQQAGGTGDDGARTLAVRGTNVYLAGGFDSPTAGFGSATLANADANTGTDDLFVAKVTEVGNTGSFVWAQRAGGPGYDNATALAVSGSSVYLAGSFDSPTAGFGTTTLTSAGIEDVFMTKLTDAGSTGSFVWAQRAGGSSSDNATSLAISGTIIYVVGTLFSLASRASAPKVS